MTTNDASGPDRWRHAADVLNSLGWFLPVYIIAPAVFGLVERIEAGSPEERPGILADGVCELYGPRALSVMYLYRYRTWPFVRDFEATIFECLEASSFGFLRVGTSALAPVIEGIARAVANERGIGESNGPGPLIRDVLDDLGTRAAARPGGQSEEIELIVSSYRRFFDERFWRREEHRPEGETLNRHGLLHGITIGEDFGTRYNFSRLVSVLDLFCFLIAVVPPQGRQLSVLAPDETEESRRLATYFGSAFGRRRALDELL